MNDLKMGDADVGEMIGMCVESMLAGFGSVSVDPLHIVEMDSYYQSITGKQAEQIEILRDALAEIAKLPEVRMDECQYVACRALEQTSKD